MAQPLLEVKDLQVHFETEDGLVQAVDGISYSVDRGQALGIVGESGSGKSVSSMTVMGLTRAGNAKISGSITFDGKDLLNASDAEMRKVRGGEIAMIFQDPLLVAASVLQDRRSADRGASARTATSRRRRRATARSRCSASSGSRSRASASTATRTSSPAACASA